MTPIHFRDGQRADYDALLPLVLGLYEEDPSSTPGNVMNADRFARTFEELMAKPDKGRIVLMERDGSVVGYAILIFFWSNEYGGDLVNIDEVFVSPTHRGGGVGEAFFTWLRSEWSGRAAALTLETTPANHRAIALYERLGFRLHPNPRRFAQLT